MVALLTHSRGCGFNIMVEAFETPFAGSEPRRERQGRRRRRRRGWRRRRQGGTRLLRPRMWRRQILAKTI
jgi:hypothetical protein